MRCSSVVVLNDYSSFGGENSSVGMSAKNGGNEVETASLDDTRSFAGKGRKEIVIGWDMRL